MGHQGFVFRFSEVAVRGGIIETILAAPDDELIPLIKRHGHPTKTLLEMLEFVSADMVRERLRAFLEAFDGVGEYHVQTEDTLPHHDKATKIT